MPKSEASIAINAPIEKVFDIVTDPEKMAQYATSSVLTESNGKPDEVGSYSEFDYHVMAMTFHARMTVSEVDKPYRLVQEMSGSMPGRWLWNLQQDGTTVKVDFCIEYSAPRWHSRKNRRQALFGAGEPEKPGGYAAESESILRELGKRDCSLSHIPQVLLAVRQFYASASLSWWERPSPSRKRGYFH